MYYDLNIKFLKTPVPNDFLEKTLKQLLEYGYQGVAVTIEIDQSVFEELKNKSKKKKKSVENEIVPPPLDLKQLKQKYPKLQIYRRINICISESENIRKILQSKNLKLYDLISFQPESQSVLKSLTGIGDVDIISYNPESKCTLSLTRKLYKQFVNQNVYFELLYKPALTSQNARKNLISLSHLYHAVGKSKNIIVSSGTHLPNHVRAPYDIINFNLLFGLSEEQAKKALASNCEKLLLKARRQRRGKNIVEVKEIKDVEMLASSSSEDLTMDE